MRPVSFSIGKWLVPTQPPKPKPWSQRLSESLPHHISWIYLRNNVQFLFFLFVIVIGINVALFIHRAYYFRDFANLDGSTPNPFYMLSRANGKSCKCVDTFVEPLSYNQASLSGSEIFL